MSTRPPLRTDSRRTREAILDAAAVVLSREPHPTLAVIAQQAGVSRATIYRHFEGIDQLRAAMLDEITVVAQDLLRGGLTFDAETTFPDQLVTMLRGALPIRTRYSRAMAHEPALDAGATALFTPLVTAWIKQAQRAAQVRADLDPELMAEALIAVIFHAARRVHRDGVAVPDAMLIVEVVVRGMLPRGA